MANLHGFALVADQQVAEVNSRMRLYRHIQTGAEVLSVENDDENKCFGVVFGTPPPDSTGLPHILEHAVLGGSRKYPVKDPFMEMVKGSLQFIEVRNSIFARDTVHERPLCGFYCGVLAELVHVLGASGPAAVIETRCCAVDSDAPTCLLQINL